MFTLELPSYVSPSTSLVPTPLPVVAIGNRGRPLDGMSVILVEDDDAVRRLTSRLLQRSGGVVEMFDNANDAVAALEARARSGDALHLVVTDLRLPRGNGADVIDAARAVSKNIALVAISGFLEDPIVAERAARGELSFLPKPFSEAQLLRAIDDARQFIM
jgi:DNA-binding NtrC family response regulator